MPASFFCGVVFCLREIFRGLRIRQLVDFFLVASKLLLCDIQILLSLLSLARIS